MSTIRANTITDTAGTGAPTFSNGITSDGNVGIGTSSPAVKLDVFGTGLIQRLNNTTSTDVWLRFDGTGTSFPYIGILGGVGVFGNNDANPITFKTNSVERLRIDSTGAIGIGGANYGTSGQVLTSGGSGAAPSWADGINRGTAVASTSGTAITFTGIPSWAKRITMMFNEVSTTGTSLKVVQIGSTTFPITGYVSRSSGMTTGVSTVSSTSGFVMNQNVAVETFSGAMTVLNIDGNTWVSNHVIGISTPQDSVGAGRVTLSGVLDRIRITTIAGTDTFDAGSVNIMWE